MLKHIWISYILVTISSGFAHAGISDNGINPQQISQDDTGKIKKDTLLADADVAINTTDPRRLLLN